MSSIYNYVVSYIYSNNSEPVSAASENISKYLITIDDLQKVNLKPVKNVIANPARNAPANLTKFDLRNLNKAQLSAILSVKLKPTPPRTEKKTYKIRHPVLRELLTKFDKEYDKLDENFVYVF
jgi:hypothetical protein